ncbi:MAG: hypothetical protein M1827_000290 [Pycnora praestabilis]|nr:MAG: hypothetical protein M1827_000290 [Pycnora praestabilis]
MKSSRPSLKQQGSGESVSGEPWFDNTNNNVRKNVSSSLIDGDPPFYIGQHISTSDDLSVCAAPSESTPQRQQAKVDTAMPAFTTITNSNNTGSLDFRMIIDDLTVKNKKLREILERQERLRSSHSDRNKLFELKVHGLSMPQKRQLEETLVDFVNGLNGSRNPSCASPSQPNTSVPLRKIVSDEPPSSCTSYSRPVDSAYASMSMSGQTSTAKFGPATDSKPKSIHPTRSREQKVHSYLHDIPQGPLPRCFPAMTENIKKRVVVKRLEQLFTGKAATKTGMEPSQPVQQEGVSRSAAWADQMASEASGRKVGTEGMREAHMLPAEATIPLDDLSPEMPSLKAIDAKQSSGDRSKSDGDVSSRSLSSNQRPTRPIDLDPHRPQVPAENIEYIRHLGLPSPKIHCDLPDDGDDCWVYLNLLINMAQLHTMNVTTDFVRKAVSDVSAKFELSHDRRWIRWRGGTTGTTLSSISSSNEDQGDASSSEEGEDLFRQTGQPCTMSGSNLKNNASKSGLARYLQSSNNIQVSTNKSSEVGSSVDPPPVFVHRSDPANKFAYQPLFYHHPHSEEEDDLSLDRVGSVTSTKSRRESAGDDTGSQMAMDANPRPSSPRKTGDEGLITFYNKGGFCTDLTGDKSMTQGSMPWPIEFRNPVSDAIGCAPERFQKRRKLSADDGVRPLMHESGLPEGVEFIDGDCAAELLRLNISPRIPSSGFPKDAHPVELEASGIGGVIPEDNFIITVWTEHDLLGDQVVPRLSRFSMPRSRSSKIMHRIPQSSIDLFFEDGALEPGRQIASLGELVRKQFDQREPPDLLPEPFQARTLSAHRIKLPPSRLPPASYIFFSSFSSASEGDEDAASSVQGNSTFERVSDPRPGPLLSLLDSDTPYAIERPLHGVDLSLFCGGFDSRSSSTMESSSDAGSSSDSSIDLLAAARQNDPDAVAAREREFEMNYGLPDLGELPAGSSAATAGGGSGYSSQNTSVSASSSSQDGIRPGNKRARTSDSMDVCHKSPRTDGDHGDY